MVVHSIELFSGVGMLGEGLRAGLGYLGIETRTLVHVEREAYATAVLAARMEEGSLDAAPIWTDVCTFDAAAWHGRVDCIVAGFPCQDLSVAGRRAGLDGKRSGLFFEVVRIAVASGAWLMFLENVAGIATATASVVDAAEGELDERAASRVLGELADRGWDAEWITLSAADVGASHGRARWFCLAWRRVDDAQRVELAGQRLHEGSRRSGSGAADSGWPSRVLADTDGRPDERRGRPSAMAGQSGSAEGQGDQRQRCRDAAHGGECELADTSGPRLPHTEQPGEPGEPGEQKAYGRRAAGQLRGAQLADNECCCDRGKEQASDHRDAKGDGPADRPGRCGSALLFAPGPADRTWPDILATTPWLAPALSLEEQHDASAAFSSAEPILRGVADGLADGLDFDQRAPRLKACGNGVVALQAAVAFVVLARRAGIGATELRAAA